MQKMNQVNLEHVVDIINFNPNSNIFANNQIQNYRFVTDHHPKKNDSYYQNSKK